MTDVPVDEPARTDDGILVGLIKESEVALRPVNRQSEKYLHIVESVRSRGILNPIVVRQLDDGTFGLIDGLHRFTACKDVGLTRVPAHVKNMDDAALLEAQIIANLAKVETKPVEYTKQLIRILSGNPTMTVSELAAKVCQSKSWVEQRLNLLKLTEPIQQLVDTDEIALTNAYALSKLPEDEQGDYVDRAITDAPEAFLPVVNARVKELKEAAKTGREANTEFVPQPRLQKLGAVKAEFESPTIGGKVCADMKAKSAEDGFAAAIAWVLRMDPASQKAAIEDDKARKAKTKEARERRKAEREEQKKAAAAEKAASITSL